MTGLDEKDKVVVKLIDTTGEDLTLALPLWAHVPEAQQANAIDRAQHHDGGQIRPPVWIAFARRSPPTPMRILFR